MVEKPGAGISLLLSKTPKGLPDLTSPSEGRISIDNKHPVIINAQRRNLGFNPDIFWEQKSWIELM